MKRHWMLLIIVCFAVFGTGLAIGARGYYLYADRIYRKYPAFFLCVLQRRISENNNEHLSPLDALIVRFFQKWL